MAPAAEDLGVARRLVCGWCGRLLQDGPGPVSHGMCATCQARFSEGESGLEGAPTKPAQSGQNPAGPDTGYFVNRKAAGGRQ